MKARKTMKNQALVAEVISQISQRFSPKIPDIKKVSQCTLSTAAIVVNLDSLPGHRHFIGEGIH